MTEDDIDYELHLLQFDMDKLLRRFALQQALKNKLVQRKNQLKEKRQFKKVLSNLKDQASPTEVRESKTVESPETAVPERTQQKPEEEYLEFTDYFVLNLPLKISSSDFIKTERSFQTGAGVKQKSKINGWMS